MLRIVATSLVLLSACSSAPDILTGAPTATGELAAAQGNALPPPDLSQPGAAKPAAEPMPSVSDGFNPATQHFVWVLPPGIHGQGPWDFDVQFKVRGEVKHETTVTLKGEKVPAGSRPEYPAGYEIIRLTDDGSWPTRAAELDKVVASLITQYGRGSGEMEMQNNIKLSIDESHRKAYCVDGQTPDVRVYMDEDGNPGLIPLSVGMETAITAAVRTACGD